MSASSRYTQQHFQDFAALLAAEREQNGPSPALNRILAAVTQLFAENNPRFNRELFGKAARGTVSPTARPQSLRKPPATSDRSERGWTPPVITPLQEECLAGTCRHPHEPEEVTS
jgi:hypothetical protein